jgi:hypothetical protein
MSYAFFWVIPRRLNNSDAGELSRRTHTIFKLLEEDGAKTPKHVGAFVI